MEDAVAIILFLFAEILFFKFAYFSGWIFLKFLSLGRIVIQPKREKWNKREEEETEYHLTDMQTAIVGFILWITILVVYFVLDLKS